MRRSAIIAARNPEKRPALEAADIQKPQDGGSIRVKKKFCPPRTTVSGTAASRIMPKNSNTSVSTNTSIKPLAYRIFFCARSNKKHKSYCDGILIRKGNTFTLFNELGKQLASKLLNGVCELGQGSEVECGSYDVEVDKIMDFSEYESGSAFIASQVSGNDQPPARKKQTSKTLHIMANKGNADQQNFQNSANNAVTNSRNNPFALNALVLYKPLNDHSSNARYVTLCPFLSDRLRPHQREGVLFLYNCLTGVTNPNHYGAILADEMGLGKTLQCISVIWTLLKDGPSGPVISRAIVVVPSSLVDNWANEFKKWVGDYRIQILSMQSSLKSELQKEIIQDFVKVSKWPVLIISYEMCRKFAKDLSALSSSKKGVLLVCDEGHRLKNAQGNQTIAALEDVGAKRRLIITGTPIQNQLDELYAMCSFVNPGLLSTLESFRNNFIKPIVAWREAGSGCSHEETALGQKRADMLQKLTSSFILRRTSSVLSKYLPPKTECVLFCKLSDLQVKLYSTYVTSQVVSSVINASDVAAALMHITALRKLVNDPSLFYKSENQHEFPTCYDREVVDSQHSGKLAVLESILTAMHSHQPSLKTVIVSNFTQTLTVIDKLCASKQWKTLRLDGSTPAQTRQSLVTKFNSPDCPQTVFLLSAKAGGCGLNLIGASRLILFDPDWNPATDEQAMGRIWRDGQQCPCIIYRLLTTGGIDEKIFQRQLTKQELSMVVDGKENNVCGMSHEELKKLFALCHEEQFCQTKVLLDNRATTESFLSWNLHCDPLEIDDPILSTSLNALPSSTVSFAMSKSVLRNHAAEEVCPAKPYSYVKALTWSS